MKHNLFQPVFLVGCSRSGTTFLQSLLAAHPQITSVKETHFYQFMIPRKNEEYIRYKFQLVSCQLKPYLKQYFEQEIKRPELLQNFPYLPIMLWQNKAFLRAMQHLTQEQGNKIFLEKTPDHIYYLSYIEKLVPNAKFIHIIRSGKDVIASLYEVTHKYPKPWGGARDIDTCIWNWLQAIQTTQKYIDRPNHIIVGYQKLVENPRSTLEKLCSFLELYFDKSMLSNYVKSAEDLTYEAGGRTVCSKIKNTRSTKFFTVFDEAQQEYILNKINKINLESLKAI